MLLWFGAYFPFLSLFWFILEGAVIGLVMGYSATKFGGEGKAAVAERPL
jgi:hypothetical protein|tara:strand:+ start:1352 stop:1498 length:147 start_codon:yes stop_codon:yes gene_type:complete